MLQKIIEKEGICCLKLVCSSVVLVPCFLRWLKRENREKREQRGNTPNSLSMGLCVDWPQLLLILLDLLPFVCLNVLCELNAKFTGEGILFTETLCKLMLTSVDTLVEFS